MERFDKTLKHMLKKVMEVDRKNWDQLLPHVLFATREVPQASTGFHPFELLYGNERRPRGLLDIARDTWESQPSPHRTVASLSTLSRYRAGWRRCGQWSGNT